MTTGTEAFEPAPPEPVMPIPESRPAGRPTADSITIQLANGRSVTIAVDSATAYHQQTTASSSDVRTGGTVLVRIDRGSVANGGSGPTASDITVTP